MTWIFPHQLLNKLSPLSHKIYIDKFPIEINGNIGTKAKLG